MQISTPHAAARLVDDFLAWAAQCIGDGPDKTAIS
jgi:hypothetical protein